MTTSVVGCHTAIGVVIFLIISCYWVIPGSEGIAVKLRM
jgi:hypothetical protein